ncbi:MAG: acetyl-CoA acetyltransferase [Dehalococcoidia bacterium]|nr:acetyl-CoA acetyltransferase [Dehalococcoidia bacterium]
MATGIRDKVVILGMGCTKFGERWDVGAEQLMVESFTGALADAGIDRSEIQAAWLGNAYVQYSVGRSAVPLSLNLRLSIPVTRVENFCATGTEAFRAACYAVASGATDIAMALGAEKLKDTGYGGLPNFGSTDGIMKFLLNPSLTPPGSFAQLASAYATKHSIPMEDLKRAIAHISVKSHANAVHNPRAHLRKPISMEEALAAPIVAYPLGLYDCCGVSDGSACAIVTTPEIARSMGKKDLISVKALQISASNGSEIGFDDWDGDHFETTARCSVQAYKEAGITRPREEISMMEVHDCFSITELVTMEDLYISERGGAVKDVMEGFFDRDGKVPCQIDGGLKCFGHPIGASGLRMMYEMYLQLLGRAGPRQLPNPRFGLTHNLGGPPSQNVCSIGIVGHYGE